MRQKNRTGIWMMVLLFGLGVQTGCGGGGGGGGNGDSEPLTPPSVNMSGTWEEEEVINGNCSGESYPAYDYNVLTITQSGNTVTIWNELEDEEMEGVLSGRTLTFDTSVTDADGTMSFSFIGTCSADGESFEGTAEWIWREPGYTCSGTTRITAEKVSQTQVDATGTWTGYWESSEYGISGGFSADIIDTQGDLSGTISIPYIAMNGAGLTGTVEGRAITFGDIDGTIIFSGVIADDMTASGSYTYDGMGDEGTWSGGMAP